jgi:hypothetical protein
LSHLDISDTDINTGLEYLPTENLKQFLCYVKNRPQSKVIEIARFCDGGAIIDKINKEIFIQNQFALMKEKGMELKEEKKEIKTVYKSSQQ